MKQPVKELEEKLSMEYVLPAEGMKSILMENVWMLVGVIKFTEMENAFAEKGMFWEIIIVHHAQADLKSRMENVFVLNLGIGLMSKSLLVFLRLHHALQDQNGTKKNYNVSVYILVNIWLETYAENVDQMKDGMENNVFVLQNIIE